MNTLVIRTKPRKAPTGLRVTFDVIGTGACADQFKADIRELEHYPAKATRRALIDLVGLIDKQNLRVCSAQQGEDDGQETWTFVVQG